MKQYLLFDLDGTLTDPKVGITTCVQYALKSFGIEEEDTDKLEAFIGPPLKESFETFYHFTPQQAEEAVAKYRERFTDTGIFENELYPGVHDMLRSLKAGGMHLAVASSKPTVFVERILKHFKLDKYFEVVVGSELDGTRVDKAQVIHEALRRFFGDKPIAYDQVYMIGDRKHDIAGARTFHIESVGVTYGYGSMEELKEAKADYIVQSVAELKKFLMREVEDARRKDEEQKKQAGVKPANKGAGVLWKLLLPFILFILVKFLVRNLCYTFFSFLTTYSPQIKDALTITAEDGSIALRGFVIGIAELIAYLGAGWSILKFARPAIIKTAEEMKLSHLKKEPVVNYLLIFLAAAGCSVGMNELMDLSGVMEASEAYQNTAMFQKGIPFVIGLILYGAVVPLAEELLFRGLFYNGMKKFMKRNMALLLSSFIFGYYFGNSIESMYGFVLGLILAYGYEYFGDFRVAVGAHMLANLLAYTLTYFEVFGSAMAGWPVCVVSLLAAAAAIFVLYRQKKKPVTEIK